MTDELNTLLEWIIFYVKNKDIMKKEIKDYKVLKNYVEFEFKDKKQLYYAYPELNKEVLERYSDGWVTIVCLNNKENINFVVSNWDKLTKNPKFQMIFVHPSSNQRWIIFPYTHDKITEKKTLKLGLETIAQEVSMI